MSTDLQENSTANQAEAIARYAEHHGLEIVRTYADEGKSGLDLDWRPALQQLIADITTGRADFEMVLVYDVSRWGRFQDPDKAAHLEYLCRQAGIPIEYCAEQFVNDGSPHSSVLKVIKRIAASDFSRDLSIKVFAGQCRLIGLGFRQGGPAGYGLRRQMVDHCRQPKTLLERGERKSLQTDRVILIPGPEEERETVGWMYRTFVEDGLSEGAIATRLNAQGRFTDLGRPWTRATVHQVLTNEKYIGNNVFNRRSFKLKCRRVANAPSEWVRADGAFEAIVEPELFAAAQALIIERSRRFTDAEMLDHLKGLLARQGYLSGLIIDECEDMPSSGAFRHRFGSLVRAYALIGYQPGRDYRYIDINRQLRDLHPKIVADALERIRATGGRVEIDPRTDLLTINEEFTVSLVLSRCQETSAGSRRWVIRFDTGLAPDVTVAVRMTPDNDGIHDYYLLPSIDMMAPKLRLAEENGAGLDTYRYDGLETLVSMARRVAIKELCP